LKPARAGGRREARSRRHRGALELLTRLDIPFLVGGGHALRHYAGGVRATKDLDVFVRRADAEALLDGMSAAGFETDLTFPHWLGKAHIEGDYIDVIYSSGNGLAEVDDGWFTYSHSATVLGVAVKLCPPEEMIWSKAFVMERERFDGADIAHLIRAFGERLDWRRLLGRFGPHWRVLLSHLILFGFIYPGERAAAPPEVMQVLSRRLEREVASPPSERRLCQGTLLSREQYLADISRWGYEDGRLMPRGQMTAEEVEHWTAAIDPGKGEDDAPGSRG
jgi:Aminoglycoside-2''-adenylyltransferase